MVTVVSSNMDQVFLKAVPFQVRWDQQALRSREWCHSTKSQGQPTRRLERFPGVLRYVDRPSMFPFSFQVHGENTAGGCQKLLLLSLQTTECPRHLRHRETIVCAHCHVCSFLRSRRALLAQCGQLRSKARPTVRSCRNGTVFTIACISSKHSFYS
jgi:hypothetical protein